MANRKGKRRCDFCPSLATVWLWYTTRSYPSGRMSRSCAASCSAHEFCPHFEGMKLIASIRDPELVREERAP